MEWLPTICYSCNVAGINAIRAATPNREEFQHESHRYRPRRRQGRAGRPAWLSASWPHRTGQLTPSPAPVIEEESPQWDCRTMGNLVCGPDNAQGVTPGDYSNPNC